MNADIKFGKILTIDSQDTERNEILTQIKAHNSGTNLQQMTCNNPKLDPVKMNAYIKLGENMLVNSEDIEQKRNFGENQGPYIWYKCAKNYVLQS